MSFDIIRLEVNTLGRDIIIADLHGNNGCLESVIKQLNLKQDDRLFIAGDLVDRGPDNVGIIDTIRKSGVSIFSIRGNHEQMTLDSIMAIEDIIAYEGVELDKFTFRSKLPLLVEGEDTPDNIRRAARRVLNHQSEGNGGSWLVDLFFKEMLQGKIWLTNDMMIGYSPKSKINIIAEYMNELPYIVSVAGNDDVAPFNVVHSDMPINDHDLERRVEERSDLTESEKWYAMWARKKDFDGGIGRTMLSVVSYCGHSIVSDKKNDCLRQSTSMINLDGAAYLTDVSLVVNHTERKGIVVVNQSQQVDEVEIESARNIILDLGAYLIEKNYLDKLLVILRDVVNDFNSSNNPDVIALGMQSVKLINDKIDEFSVFVPIKHWSILDFIRNVHAHPGIDNVTLLLFNEKVVKSIIDEVDKEPKTPAQLMKIRENVTKLCDYYNFYRLPEVMLEYNDLIERKFSSYNASQVGLFSSKEQLREQKESENDVHAAKKPSDDAPKI